MRSVLQRICVVAVAVSLLAAAAACGPVFGHRVDPQTGSSITAAGRLFAEGERLLAAGQSTEALLAFRQAYRSDPSHEPTLRRLAAAYEAQGRRRLATHMYEQLLARRPDDPEVRQAAAALHDALGQASRAVELRRGQGSSAPAQQPAEGPALLWGTFLEEEAVSGLALSDDAVFAATQGGALFCLDRQDGSVRWEVSAPKPIISAPSYTSGPGVPLVIVGAEDNRLYAFNALDGSPRWTFDAPAALHGTPAAHGDSVYVGSGDGTLYSLRRSTGTMLWHYAAGGAIHAGPLVAGNTVYFGALDCGIYAVNAETGRESWRFTAADGVESSPALYDNLLFVGANDTRLYCLDAQTGDELWHYSTGDTVYAEPLVTESHVYVASTSYALSALSPTTGELQWHHDGASFLTAAPALDDRVLYLTATADPYLYALDARTGRLIWRHDTGDWPATGPLLADGNLYLGEKDGTVLAYRLP